MRRHLTIVLLALAAVVGGCGSDDEQPATAAAGEPATVNVEDIDGTGKVLVDSESSPLYTSEQEQDGKIRCMGGCLGFWLPASVMGEPTPGADVPGELGVVERNDGTRQLTYDGVPVYRFSEDAAGKVAGDGLEDEFGGKTFTWHVLTIDGSDNSGGGTGGRGGYGY
jgi:predicted lipoprotein with Yx(FWY)xxD motif